MTLYNATFYDKQSEGSYNSAKAVFDILKRFKISSVADFGCGVGSWLAAACEAGISDIWGTDGDYVPVDKLMIPKSCFEANDLSKIHEVNMRGRRFDLAISLEVAEHLDSDKAQSFIELLCASADAVLFSAAIPYQGGHGHVNENWPEYWARIFQSKGYQCFDIVRPSIWRNSNVAWWYRQNIFLFVNKNIVESFFQGYKFKAAFIDELSVVHPEQYLLAVHREKGTVKRSLADDSNYWRDLFMKEISSVPGYGVEYSYVEEQNGQIDTLDELKAIPIDMLDPVVSDAIFDTKYAANPPKFDWSSVEGRVPDFLSIGVQKSATTWLYNLLQCQESIWLPPLKELNFFNYHAFDENSSYNGRWRRRNALKRLSLALSNNLNMHPDWLSLLYHLTLPEPDHHWYSSIFDYAPQKKIVGEITPEYAMLPVNMIHSIYQMNQELKVIILLRDPVARTLSHLKMIKKNFSGLSDNVLLDLARQNSVYSRSDYATILRNWLSVFPKDQIFIGIYEEIFVNPELFVSNLGKFLGFNLVFHEKSQSRVHEGENGGMDEEFLRGKLNELMSDIVLNSKSLLSGL